MGKKVNINIEKLEDALKNIKARFECGQIAHMKEITSSSFYVNGMYRALSMGNDTFISRFNNPEELTLNDILKLADKHLTVKLYDTACYFYHYKLL
ncbi:hypothetical protein [Sphingobacterium thermophilum]|uniref:Phage protein n=1 Tax=Sphingobacterium thermophilum TaxID=768534 RepID=A0ABP8QWE4_9SPHI